MVVEERHDVSVQCFTPFEVLIRLYLQASPRWRSLMTRMFSPSTGSEARALGSAEWSPSVRPSLLNRWNIGFGSSMDVDGSSMWRQGLGQQDCPTPPER